MQVGEIVMILVVVLIAILLIYLLVRSIRKFSDATKNEYRAKKQIEQERARQERIDREHEYQVELEKSKHTEQTIVVNKHKKSVADIIVYILLGIAIVALVVVIIVK